LKWMTITFSLKIEPICCYKKAIATRLGFLITHLYM